MASATTLRDQSDIRDWLLELANLHGERMGSHLLDGDEALLDEHIALKLRHAANEVEFLRRERANARREVEDLKLLIAFGTAIAAGTRALATRCEAVLKGQG